ncbi:MAG: glycosyltransferase, partial [Actinomycetota bacterium]
AEVRPIGSGLDDELDVVLFNHEPQWLVLDRFRRARRRVFYALHDGHCYGKEGSWESIHAAVDLRLANSGWTADRIEAHTGHRPVVQLGGVNREVFHPAAVRRSRPLLCSGERQRAWKGTDTIEEAARLAGVPYRGYAGRGLSQAALGREYASARVFVVGSWYEGFCQPGLEALACGTPLVTTDNGGCREYARDGETALVVAPRDAVAMANAIRRLLDDPGFARTLAANGLDLVASDFDWEQRTDEFAAVLDGLVASASSPPPGRPPMVAEPRLSVAVIASADLLATQRAVDAVRWGTDVPYELIVADPGGPPEVGEYVTAAADRVVDGSGGPVAARNAALAAARAPYLAVCRAGASVPDGWASRMIDAAETSSGPSAATVVVVPEAVPLARVSVQPDGGAEPLGPFVLPPAAPVALYLTAPVRELGGWAEALGAPAADIDLVLRAGANDLGVVVHRGVAVGERWRRRRRGESRLPVDPVEREKLVARWSAGGPVVRLDSCPPDRHEVLATRAGAAVEAFARELRVGEARERREQSLLGRDGPVVGATREWALGRWRALRPRIPVGVADRIGAFGRRLAR